MPAVARPRYNRAGGPQRFLTIDIGGSGLKAAVVDRQGQMLTERMRVKTPADLTPQTLVAKLATLVEPLGEFDRVLVGFPGVVRDGGMITAPNLSTDRLKGYDLARALRGVLQCRVRVANDAVIQGLAAIRGEGIKLVITLGTGFGTAVFDRGRPLPTLELAHHPFAAGMPTKLSLGRRRSAESARSVGTAAWRRPSAPCASCFTSTGSTSAAVMRAWSRFRWRTTRRLSRTGWASGVARASGRARANRDLLRCGFTDG